LKDRLIHPTACLSASCDTQDALSRGVYEIFIQQVQANKAELLIETITEGAMAR